MAMAFTQNHPSVTASIIGPRTREQLDETLKGSSIRLSSDLLDAIDKIVAPGKTVEDYDPGWIPDWLTASCRRR